MKERPVSDANLRRLPIDELRTVLSEQDELRRYQLARELAARYCPAATKVEVEGEDESMEDGSVFTRAARLNFLDSTGSIIDLEKPEAAWHVVHTSPELRNDFYQQTDFDHDPAGARDWLSDELYIELTEGDLYALVDHEIDLRHPRTGGDLYVKKDDGSYAPVDDLALGQLKEQLDDFDAWVSTRDFLDRYAPMAVGIQIDYSAEYDDEGGYYSTISDVLPLGPDGTRLELGDEEVAMQCIKANPDLAKTFAEEWDDDPEGAPEFLEEQINEALYNYDWSGRRRIYVTPEQQPPEAYVPVKEEELVPA